LARFYFLEIISIQYNLELGPMMAKGLATIAPTGHFEKPRRGGIDLMH
jgi:hypothetical protein